MKEPEARTVRLVKVIELASQATALLSEVQRQSAGDVALAAGPRPSSESKRNGHHSGCHFPAGGCCLGIRPASLLPLFGTSPR